MLPNRIDKWRWWLIVRLGPMHSLVIPPFPLTNIVDEVGEVFSCLAGDWQMCSIHKGRVHIQFLDKTHWGKQGQTNLRKYVCFHLQDKPADMKVKGDGWGYRPAIYFESVNPILMIVLKKNVAKKVDVLIGMSEKVATRSRVQRLNKPSKDDILRGFPLK